MTTNHKIRIYDLAREKTPTDLDDKIQKKIQAEITRQVIEIAPQFGQNPKTASSSIETSILDDLLSKVDFQKITEDCSSGKRRKPAVKKEKPAEEPKAEEAPKRKIKIVRRLSVVAKEEEEAEQAAAKAAEEEAKAAEAAPVEPEAEETPEETVPEEAPADHVKDIVDSLQKGKKDNNKSSNTKSISSKIGKVKSIPLRPSKASADRGGQPYRVGKPTIMPQGMGRKKKRATPEERARRAKVKPIETTEEEIKELYVTEAMTVRELAQKMEIPETEIITHFFMQGVIKTVNEVLEKDLIVEFAESKDILVYTEEDTSHIGAELRSTLAEDESEGSLISRPPVVTIMGHVDHGKTTLLDAIREAKTNVVDGESGGITQHIGAYQVVTKDYDGHERALTFLDTPGHEAFTSMRKRGANITDIVILVVAADDGVMPQTIEAIKHTKEAKVPFLVAVNKIDKEGANTDRVLGQLAEHEIVAEQYGGPVVCSFISAMQKKNLDDLLEKIVLVADAELSEKIRSNPNRHAVGTVVEAELSRAKGPIATILVQNGTLKKGDHISAGGVAGRVRAMFNDTGAEVTEAGPSTPIKLLGLTGVPKAGDNFKAHESAQVAKKEAEELAHKALEEKRLRGLSVFASEFKEQQESECQVIIKADVQGSAEAVAQELNKLSTDEVLVKPIEVSSGSITTNDVNLAARTGAMIVGFHVGPDASTAKLAKKLGVDLKTYEVIYKLTEDLKVKVLGLHAPEIEEVKLGMLEVRQLFTIGKAKKVAGCYVKEGKVVRNEIARLFREGVQIFEGRVDYLKRFKDDAKEVKESLECGLSFEKFNDIQEGDTIECWTVKEIARTEL